MRKGLFRAWRPRGPERSIAPLVRRPARLNPEEPQHLADRPTEAETAQPKGVSVGHSILVREGPFGSFPGIVEPILPSDRTKSGVSLFGRTSIVIEIAQVASV